MESSKPKTDEEKQEAAKAQYEKLLTMRSGGTYIPPARLRALQSQITDKSSKAYQRMAWEALKKSINGLINKVNVSNIKHIVPELFGENLIRGRGLFCRSIMKAQASSLPFTPIYAVMAAIVNTKLPNVGELLLKRLIVQFKKGFKRNDKAVCLSATTFIAHLCNQQVANEVIAAQILLLLLHKPTDDSVEIAVGLTREVGQHLEEMNQVIALAVFDQFRNILHEADIDKRVQYMIEVLFQVRKDKYKDNPAIKEELDLVEEEDQITHVISLDDEINVSDDLNIFKFDPNWEANEEQYGRTKAEIFGEVSDEDGDTEEDSEDSEDDEEKQKDKAMEIKDQSNSDLVTLRKTIYLTIMSSIDPEECCHKLMKVQLPGGMEHELPSMIVECCSQEKTYSKFYGLVGEQFAKINRLWTQLFEESFSKYFETIHRYETNRLRNIARFFGHLLCSDGIGWHVLSIVHLNEEETTASSRIFIKILFEDLVEAMGMPKLQARLKDDIYRPYFEGIFPKENQRNIRFSINYFTSIKMGPLTEEMREYLANMPKQALPGPPTADDDSESDSSSVSSYSSYSCSSNSKSLSPARNPGIERRRSPSSTGRHEGDRGRSQTRSTSRSASPYRRYDRYSRSITPPRRGRSDSSHSRSPRMRDRMNDNSVSRSRSCNARDRERSLTRSTSRSITPYRRDRYSRSLSSPQRGRQNLNYSRSPRIRDRAQAQTNGHSLSPSRRRSVSQSNYRSSLKKLRSPSRKHLSTSSRPRIPRCDDRSPGSLRRGRSTTPPRRGRSTTPPRRDRSKTPSRKGRRYSSYSNSRSPPPNKRRRKDSESRSPPRHDFKRDNRSFSPPSKKRRNYSGSRSPPPRRGREYR